MENNSNQNTFNQSSWSRRDLLKTIAILTGGTIVGGSAILQGCKNNTGSPLSFSKAQIALLDEVGETIIPTTDTQGAKATQIGKFMNTMIADCYTPDEQTAFMAGLKGFDTACQKLNKKDFMSCNEAERKAFLVSLEKEAKAFDTAIDETNKKDKELVKPKGWLAELEFIGKPKHYYTMMKQLTLYGYFTSEIGMTKAMQYNPVPTKYSGAYDYKVGDKVFCS
jgi:hypothetical protein